jgi:hypothetical protein
VEHVERLPAVAKKFVMEMTDVERAFGPVAPTSSSTVPSRFHPNACLPPDLVRVLRHEAGGAIPNMGCAIATNESCP